jgi:hypothetical protein
MGRRVSNIELSRFRGWRGRNDSGRDAREERTPRDHGSETSTAGLATGLRKECWYLCWSKIFCMRGQGRQQQFGAQQNRAWGTRPAAAGQIMRARPAAAVEGQQRPPSCLIEGRATLAEERVKPWWRRLVGQAKMGAAAALLWRRRLAMSGGVAPQELGLPRLALMDGNQRPPWEDKRRPLGEATRSANSPFASNLGGH